MCYAVFLDVFVMGLDFPQAKLHVVATVNVVHAGRHDMVAFRISSISPRTLMLRAACP